MYIPPAPLLIFSSVLTYFSTFRLSNTMNTMDGSDDTIPCCPPNSWCNTIRVAQCRGLVFVCLPLLIIGLQCAARAAERAAGRKASLAAHSRIFSLASPEAYPSRKSVAFLRVALRAVTATCTPQHHVNSSSSTPVQPRGRIPRDGDSEEAAH